MHYGQIIEGRGGLYTVAADENQYVLRAKGKFRKQGLTPLVGDYINFTPGSGDEHGWIEEILPRKSLSIRPPVANIDLILITIAASPQPDLILVDKLIMLSRKQGIENIILYNKQDLNSDMSKVLQKEYEKSGAAFFKISAINGEGLDCVKAAMQGKLCCMAGQSGVGKSTVLNALFGYALETGDISRRIERGKHTTRHASLMEKNGIKALDTPGFSLLEFEKNMNPVLLQDYYAEFDLYKNECRFSPCYHLSEPGCRVLRAVDEGDISKARMNRYHLLLNELISSWRNRYD